MRLLTRGLDPELFAVSAHYGTVEELDEAIARGETRELDSEDLREANARDLTELRRIRLHHSVEEFLPGVDELDSPVLVGLLLRVDRLLQWAEQNPGDVGGDVRGRAIPPLPVSCRVCGCTDEDCSGCVARTGKPCHWVEFDLCSACAAGAP